MRQAEFHDADRILRLIFHLDAMLAVRPSSLGNPIAELVADETKRITQVDRAVDIEVMEQTRF
jgi:hypothetical protein